MRKRSRTGKGRQSPRSIPQRYSPPSAQSSSQTVPRPASAVLRSRSIPQPKTERSGSIIQPTAARLLVVWAILMVGMGLLGVNLVRLQVFQAPTLLQKARSQQTTFLNPFIPRRPVLDRNGNVMAMDSPVYALYAHPVAFKRKTKPEVAARLAAILAKPIPELLQKLDARDSGIRLETALSESAADRIRDLGIDGLELSQQPQRVYPQEHLSADVVGYVDADRQGQAGVEYSHKNLLERTIKSVRLSRTGKGEMMPDNLPEGFLHTDNLRLQLTIDSRVQRAARSALQQQVKKYGAKRGLVMVMDAQNGELRALISEPTYDPNEYYKANLEQFKNWALTDLYEPGSTFKPINVAIALDAGAVKPEQIFNDEGSIQVGGWPIRNFDYEDHGARGPSTITQILERSSNVGMVHMIQQMQPASYYEWLQKIGLGHPTGTDLPFEIAGQLKDRKTFIHSPVDIATAAFGQGFAVTPIQLLQLHGLLASGGKLLTPHVVQGLYDDRNQSYWQPHTSETRSIFSPTTTQTVLEMMESVVRNGTGRVAQIPGYRIAGKTGTAQKASTRGGYLENAKITSFVGIFPVDSPRYVVVAVIDEPRGEAAFGSTVTAPIVKSVMETLIAIDKIAPTQAIPSPAAIAPNLAAPTNSPNSTATPDSTPANSAPASSSSNPSSSNPSSSNPSSSSPSSNPIVSPSLSPNTSPPRSRSRRDLP